MKFEPTVFRDLFVVTPQVHADERGFFMESYRKDEFEKAGIRDVFVQDNHSSSVSNVIRGLHFQYGPPMSKLMRVTRGAAFLVAVDIRKNSPTLGQWFGLECSENDKRQVYAPAGFARGFQALTDNCEIQYKCSALYDSQTQGEIAWNDPEINIDWPIKNSPILSERNKTSPTFKDWLKRAESDIFVF